MNQARFDVKDVAQATGVSRWLVTRYIRRTQPQRHQRSWRRFDEAEFRAVCEHLTQLKAQYPKQPLYALRAKQGRRRLARRARWHMIDPMQTNTLESIRNALSIANAATLRLSHATMQNGELLSASGQTLTQLADEGTQEALDKADVTFQEVADGVLLLAQQIAKEIPGLAHNVAIIEQHAPNLAAAVDTYTAAQKKEAADLLAQLERLIGTVSTAIDSMETMSQLVARMKGISPAVDTGCDALTESIADLRAVFNQNWFSLREMAHGLKGRLN